jgi:hypothetical protein
MWFVFSNALICVSCYSAASALKIGSSVRTTGAGNGIDSAADFLLDAKMQTQQMDDLKSEVGDCAEHVKAGGGKARSVSNRFTHAWAMSHARLRKAFARLLDLSNQCALCHRRTLWA